MTRKLHGVVYPDPAPAPRAHGREQDEELAIARRYVREGFDPPLPDIFGDWYMHLHSYVRDGYKADTMITIPGFIIDLGFTFDRAERMEDNTWALTLSEALRVFGREDLLLDEIYSAKQAGVEISSMEGAVSLAAALAARGLPSSVNMRRMTGVCVLQLTDVSAQRLADLILPAEGSVEDQLAEALELLDALTDTPPLGACATDFGDHGGPCQVHHQMVDGQCAHATAQALLVRSGVREEQT